jgi:serine/threonine protein kinase/Leucine-rich repeat (LRR) protein
VANPVQAHPEADQLQAFSRGALADEAASQWISSHLESCPACLRTLERISSDTLESLVRAAQKPDTTADFSGAAHADAEADDLSFLAPPQAPDEIGRLGPYRVLKVLGSGGMGIVFQAEDVALKRRVALKVMKPQAARRPKAKERFLREAQAAAAIEHDHIVTIHQVGEERGVPFLAMQWLKGVSLEDRLRAKGNNPPAALSVPQIVRIGRQIALGLAAAHEQGLIHRDIKPANLWLTPEQGGRIKILDFGLARALADDVHLTQSGTIVGTPAYMAPEQARSDKIDHRCDLFSLGVVLYRLTTGRLPFRGDSTMAVLTSLAMDTPEPPRKLVAAVPVELSDLIMQLLSKDPAQRPATARAVADRLRDIDQQLGTPRPQPEQTEELAVQARPDSEPPATGPTAQVSPVTQPSGKKPSRKWPIAIAAALGVLALLAAAAVFFLQTPNGTVRIELNDDSIEATLTKNGAVIKGADKAHDITVAAGEHALKIKRGDLEFETDKFVLKKGDKVTLKIELLPGKVQVVRDDKVIGAKALPLHANDRKAAAWVLSLSGSMIIDDGQERTVSAAKDLPARPWTLHTITLSDKEQVTDASLKELAGLKTLLGLDLARTKVTDAGLKELAGLKSLQILNLNGAPVSGAGLKELAGLNDLSWLSLWDTPVTDAGLKELANLKSLQWLSLGNTKVTDAGLKELAGLKSLHVLYLYNTKVTDAGLKELAHLKSLQDLNLDNTQMTDAGLKELAGLKSLRALALGGTKVTDAGLKELAALKSLQTLSLWTTQVTHTGLKELAGLQSLDTLDLGNTQITDAGLKELASLKSLRWLHLGNTKVTDAGLKELTGLKSMQSLYLPRTPVTDAGLVHLQNLTNLKTLDLTKTKVTAEETAVLQKALPGCKIISDVTPAAGGN